jgi:hypothetical protein
MTDIDALLAELDRAALNSAGTYYGDLAERTAAAIRELLEAHP